MPVNPVGYKAMRLSLARGILNVAYYTVAKAQMSMANEGGALKDHVPSQPGEPPAVETGHLRRSLHAIGFLDGKPIGGPELLGHPPNVAGGTAKVEMPVPDYEGDIPDIGSIAGTNCGYGLPLEVGTEHMAPRPFMTPAAMDAQSRAGELIKAGASHGQS
jgi:hypothetical protein